MTGISLCDVCSCHEILRAQRTRAGIDEAASAAFEAELLGAQELLRPGFCRVSFPFHLRVMIMIIPTGNLTDLTEISLRVEIMMPMLRRLLTRSRYFFSDEVVDYVAEAVLLVATHGWRLLGQYHLRNISVAIEILG